jgi:hypothetical protein
LRERGPENGGELVEEKWIESKVKGERDGEENEDVVPS